jgi:voltage-gated potassium channel
MSPLERARAFDRFSAAVDRPMTILALVMVPLIVVPLAFELSPAAEAAVLIADYLIWSLFTLEYAVKLYLAPRRWAFVRGNLPDLVIVLVPLLGALPVFQSLRLLRLARLIAFVVEALHESRTTLRYQGIGYLLLVVLGVVFVGAAFVLEVERSLPDANITSYADALWWAMTTVSTVGYGDRFPVSPIGRGIASVLMVTGIALFGAITASIAAYFVGKAQDDHLLVKVQELHAKLDQLQEQLAAERQERSGQAGPT